MEDYTGEYLVRDKDEYRSVVPLGMVIPHHIKIKNPKENGFTVIEGAKDYGGIRTLSYEQIEELIETEAIVPVDPITEE